MIDPSTRHAEPVGEAYGNSSRQAAQLAPGRRRARGRHAPQRAAAPPWQAARDEQQRQAIREQERACPGGRQGTVGAGARPAVPGPGRPAHGRAVPGAAPPPTPTSPEAASALRRAEERLRVLHPYAMNRYDRLRSEGAAPLEAMREAAPLFVREPNARPGQPGDRPPGGRGRHAGRRVPAHRPGPRAARAAAAGP